MPQRELRVRLGNSLVKRLDHLAVDAEVHTYQVINLLLGAAVKALDAADSPRLVELFRRGDGAAEDTRTLTLQLDGGLRKRLGHLRIDWGLNGINKVIRPMLLRMVEALWKEREEVGEPWPLFLSIKERNPNIELLLRMLCIADGEDA